MGHRVRRVSVLGKYLAKTSVSNESPYAHGSP